MLLNQLVLTLLSYSFDPKEFTSPTSPYRSIFEQNQLSLHDFELLSNYCREIDINFLLTIADLSSCKLIDTLGLDRVKIGSTNITNHWLLKEVSTKVSSIILSTGASTVHEIESALSVIKSVSNCQGYLVALYC